ncbi:Remorin, C-terminal [Sesbania bispinosa]|nr:Remorin, C-terminal [Sesbania bispinosa]
MENRLNQRRVSFSDPQSQINARDDEHVTAIAAAAFSIHSLEEAGLLNLQKMREGPKFSRNLTVRGKEENISRKPSYVPGETSGRRSFGQDPHPKTTTQSAFPVRRPSGISQAAGYQKQRGIPIQHQNDKAKAEAWEKAKIERIRKRYEKIKSKILSWESEKKIQVKLQMERKKSELDHRRAMEIQHYKHKVARIDKIAEAAITQLEDLRRKEESEIREKAKKVRKTGKVPVNCFCFKSL